MTGPSCPTISDERTGSRLEAPANILHPPSTSVTTNRSPPIIPGEGCHRCRSLHRGSVLWGTQRFRRSGVQAFGEWAILWLSPLTPIAYRLTPDRLHTS